MDNNPDPKQFEVFFIIVNFGLGSKVMKIAKQNGVTGGTIFLGKGTINSHILEILDLSDVRKEIVMIVAEKSIASQALTELNRKFNFEKPKHGIAFSTTVAGFLGTRNSLELNHKESRGVVDTMHQAIFTVVDRGNAEAVIEAATAAGSRGATIINGRGSGIHENSMLFNMAIEPEKEIVMILAASDRTEAIVASIQENLKIDQPGNGIMFILDVNKTYGLR